jgi:acyl-CoA synthetase (AMP-forming)/AMP-acid ligase II
MSSTPPSEVWGTAVGERRIGARSFRVLEPRPASLPEVITGSAGWGDRTFLVQGNRRLSFAAAVNGAARAAACLRASGVDDGDHVMLIAANSPDWVVAFLGILSAGAVAVLGNGWWPRDELAHALDLAEPRLIVADAPRAAFVEHRPVLDVHDLAAADDDPVTAEPDEDDPALVVFTSGTTSRSKAAVLSHRSAVANLHNLLLRTRQLPPYDPDAPATVNLCAVPLFHMSGVQTVLHNLVIGGRLVFLDGRFDAKHVLELVETESITAWSAVPAMLAMVLDDPSLAECDLSSVRSLAIGGAPVPPALLARAHDTFPNARRRIAHSYGSTEAGGTVATGLSAPEGLEAAEILATVEVRIDGAGADGVGEIVLRSPTVMDGYLGTAPRDQPVDPDGWLRTGDLGRLDDAGRLSVTGRVKDIIIRGGENISAAAVEAAVLDHDAVVDVAVVGVPHPVWGEEVAAVVRTRSENPVGEAELAAFVGERLARFAVPSRWLLTVDPLPLTDSGKVRKAALVERFTPTPVRK